MALIVGGFAAVALIAMLVALASFSLYFHRKDRVRDRRVLVQVVAKPLIPEGTTFRGLKIMAGGLALDSPTDYTITCTNIGNETVSGEATQKPFTVKFHDGKIVSAEVGRLDSSSSQLDTFDDGVVTGKSGLDIQAPKTLLNRDCAIVFRLVVNGATRPPGVTVIADGVRLVESRESPLVDDHSRTPLVIAVVSTVISVMAIALAAVSAL